MPLTAQKQVRNRALKRMREGGTYRALTDANRQEVAEMTTDFQEQQYEFWRQRQQVVFACFVEFGKAHGVHVDCYSVMPPWFAPGVEHYVMSSGKMQDKEHVNPEGFAAKHAIAAAEHAFWIAFGTPQRPPPTDDHQWLARLARRSVAPEIPWEKELDPFFASGVLEFYSQERFKNMNTEQRATTAPCAGKYGNAYVQNVWARVQEKADAHKQECRELEAQHTEKVAKRNEAEGRAAIAMYKACKMCEPCKEAKKELRRCDAHEYQFERCVNTFLKD